MTLHLAASETPAACLMWTGIASSTYPPRGLPSFFPQLPMRTLSFFSPTSPAVAQSSTVLRLRLASMKVAVRIVCLAAMLAFGSAVQAADSTAAASLQTYYADLQAYRAELDACRQAHGGARSLPAAPFFLFGMGARTKLLYRDGILFDARTGRELRRWKVKHEIIVPPDYTVAIETEDGGVVSLREDGEAVWLEEGGQRTALEGTKSAVKLPDFAGKKYPRVLRVLHQEMLVNIVEAGPVPNFFVYEKPWYRDGAMVALALKETGNLDLLKPWILGLREPFDRNNKGESEADNLGEALFLVSLVSDKSHPLVAKVLAELPRFEKTAATGKYISGRSDFAEHPVYQTKWLKYGLRALGLPDEYVAGKDSDDRGSYPYLGWACDHFHGTKKSPLSNRDYPLTWEERASGAHYDGLKIISPELVQKRISPPHSWHAAEAFLLLLTE